MASGTPVVFLIALLLGVVASGGSALFQVDADPQPKMVPLVVNTWPFINATRKAWKSVNEDKKSAIDSVIDGCSTCEAEQCDGTVGYGGSPDENGETTLDAMIMDGSTMNVGAVGALRRVKDAIAVARAVLHHTEHTMLVGDHATLFAQTMGFKTENLTTPHSALLHEVWKRRNCQPNNWLDMVPNPKTSCGPYAPADTSEGVPSGQKDVHSQNHDTIGMLVIDNNGDIAAGTSTNGLRNKIPGRVGDSPIAGSGAYADSKVGAACATGDGDVMMRFLPSFLAVEEMRRGESPVSAAETAVRRVVAHYPLTMGAVVAANRDGEFGAACCGMKNFTFCVSNHVLGGPQLVTINCLQQDAPHPTSKQHPS